MRNVSIDSTRTERVQKMRTVFDTVREVRSRSVTRQRDVVLTRTVQERRVEDYTRQERQERIERRTRDIQVERTRVVSHTHSHDSGDDRDSASDVESRAYQSSISSVGLHSHGTTDNSDDNSGVTSDGSSHIRGRG
jgi:hypothetical protein